MARRPLGDYRGKRDFSRTGEPAGGGSDDGGNRFVVHKHHATADHYDLRLQVGGRAEELGGAEGAVARPGREAAGGQTEDHPLEYIDFEGVIPEGEYGGGPMIVWDTGTWAPMGDVEAEPRERGVQVPAGGREARRRLDAGAAEAAAGREEDELAAVQGARPGSGPDARHPRRAAGEREERAADRGAGGAAGAWPAPKPGAAAAGGAARRGARGRGRSG